MKVQRPLFLAHKRPPLTLRKNASGRPSRMTAAPALFPAPAGYVVSGQY